MNKETWVGACQIISRFCVWLRRFPWCRTMTCHAVNTYNIKEALTGINGVQQLVNVVLNEEQRRKQAKQHSHHVKPLMWFPKHMIIFIDSLSLIIITHLHISTTPWLSYSQSHKYRWCLGLVATSITGICKCEGGCNNRTKPQWANRYLEYNQLFSYMRINHSICKFICKPKCLK